MAEAAKPLSPTMRVVRVVWACLIGVALVFSILMAVWGDLREGLMLQVLDDRHVKSFTVVAPEGAKLWMGSQYLGVAEPHPLAEGEPEDTQLVVEGLGVLHPRVYFYEPQLIEQSAPGDSHVVVDEVLPRLAPGAKVVWQEKKVTGFSQALLRHDDGRLDFVVLVRINTGTEWRAVLMRVEQGESHIFTLEREEITSDQLTTDDSGFWPHREQFNGFPPDFKGQCKTVWRWFLKVHDEAAWLIKHAPGETDIRWFKLPETG
jgi:hypothetical protein